MINVSNISVSCSFYTGIRYLKYSICISRYSLYTICRGLGIRSGLIMRYKIEIK